MRSMQGQSKSFRLSTVMVKCERTFTAGIQHPRAPVMPGGASAMQNRDWLSAAPGLLPSARHFVAAASHGSALPTAVISHVCESLPISLSLWIPQGPGRPPSSPSGPQRPAGCQHIGGVRPVGEGARREHAAFRRRDVGLPEHTARLLRRAPAFPGVTAFQSLATRIRFSL